MLPSSHRSHMPFHPLSLIVVTFPHLSSLHLDFSSQGSHWLFFALFYPGAIPSCWSRRILNSKSVPITSVALREDGMG